VLYYGHRDADGRRLVDLFIASCGRDLPRGEIAAVVALRDAWASLLEIASVRSGVGLELRDLRTGELHRVRELSGTAQLQSGDAMFAWIMALPDHLELTGLACTIPRQHRERVRSAIEAELATARARWPGTPERELVGSTAWVVADALRAGARDDFARELELSMAMTPDASPDASLNVRRTELGRHAAATAREVRSGERTRSESEPCSEAACAPLGMAYDAERAPAPDEWVAIDDSSKLAAIEAHHRALGAVVPRTHAALHLIVENQLAGNDPPEARAAFDRLVGEGLDRHEAIHALGSVVAAAIWNVTRHGAPVDRDAMVRALAGLRADDWRSEQASSTRSPPSITPPITPPATPLAIPPLAHEVMYRLVVGFEEAIEKAAGNMRRDGWQDTDILDPKALLERSKIQEYLFPLGHALLAMGWDIHSAIQAIDLLSVHAFSMLSYQLHRRKTFWVDESLAFMLGCTRLDVRGEGLRLPFPSFALVFTDRETLAVAEALAARDDVAIVRGRTLRALTTYVTQVPAARGVLGLHISVMLDAGIDQWPWIVTRDLDITPDDTIDEILESRFPDVQNTDPIFRTVELRQLLSLIVNAILFATASPSWPIIAAPPRPPQVRSKRTERGARRVHEPPPDRTGEQVWHLPGKIPISQIRALRDLRDSTPSRPAVLAVHGPRSLAPGTGDMARPQREVDRALLERS
jgi:hypothetical protein